MEKELDKFDRLTEFEQNVAMDMMIRGLNWNNEDDIKSFWEEKLDAN